MGNYVALLRAVNVAGKNKVNMKNLKGALEEEGFQNVVTYIQSGNLVLSSILQTETEVAAKITKVIKAICELTIDVFVFSEQNISKSSQTIHFRQKQLAKKNAGWLLFIMKILISQDKKTTKPK
ncbi:TPA: DUF1697 domain-containing protein [Listeria monocytogenes]